MNCLVDAPIGTFNSSDTLAIILCALLNSPCVFVTPFNAISRRPICAAYLAAALAAFKVSTPAPIPAPIAAPTGPPTAAPDKPKEPTAPKFPATPEPAIAPSAAL